MPPLEPFEAARIRVILEDLERTTRGDGRDCPLQLERSTKEGSAGIVVRGIASRIAVIRLCLLIANRALEDESVTLIDDAYIHRVDMAAEGRNLQTIEIELTDDPLIVPRSVEPEPAIRKFFTAFLPVLFFVGTFLLGLVMLLYLFLIFLHALWLMFWLTFAG